MKKNKGFTLIELLIVVVIIGIIAAIAIPNMLVAIQKGKQKATMGDIRNLGNAVSTYMLDKGICPTNALDSTQLTNFYLQKLVTVDAWGQQYVYVRGGAGDDEYSVTSYGKDKAAGGPASASPGVTEYDVSELPDFNNDIIYSNGVFTWGPKTRN